MRQAGHSVHSFKSKLPFSFFFEEKNQSTNPFPWIGSVDQLCSAKILAFFEGCYALANHTLF